MTALADLLKRSPDAEEDADADELDEEELGVLREAGVLSAPSGKQRKANGGRKKNHILFAEDAEEGDYPLFSPFQVPC